jgi:hypothetical protein
MAVDSSIGKIGIISKSLKVKNGAIDRRMVASLSASTIA